MMMEFIAPKYKTQGWLMWKALPSSTKPSLGGCGSDCPQVQNQQTKPGVMWNSLPPKNKTRFSAGPFGARRHDPDLLDGARLSTLSPKT